MNYDIDRVVNEAELLDKMKKYRLLIFLVISATYLVSYFHRAAPAVVGPEIMKEFSLAPSALGFIGSMYFWAYAATALPAGLLADSWGSRKTIAVFVFLAGIGGFVFSLATTVASMAWGRFIIGFGVGVVYVAAMRILADWYKPDELATYSGVLLAVGNIGALISTTPLVLLMGGIGWRNSFSLVAVLTIAASAIAYKVIRDKPNEMGFPSWQDMAGSETREANKKTTLCEAIKVVFGNRKFYLLGLLLFSFYGTFMGVGSLWAGPYLQNIYGISKQVSGNILMMFPLGMVFGCPLSGYVSDKILKSRKKVLLWGCILHTLCYIPLLFLTDSLSIVFLYVLFFGYGFSGGSFVSCFVGAQEIYEPRFAGTAVGALNIFLFSGGAFYQYVMGAVINSFVPLAPGVYPLAAYQTAFAIPACGLLIGIIAFIFFKENRAR
ncbi:MFS transporter [Sporomusa acidovorans]|uniref:Major facilitator superfamily (MFS) profile domain-containing protein n=1 Tax=Sporomusa acidovorans (strain ATCC 49682 / DSM 3132 / Mol) TaxID=1123286 RepID=A0ABZ3J5L3_SPOA4|nr:MFS transporter [Sporomusa acidovorans]OZC24293.1 putative sulfoacetate transporter SauU [Sporomusa acidovorans DSM 3132]SDF02793.1 Sugar phosphate permease [Sporomusa acidovorans]